MISSVVRGSFRDPAGFVFREDGVVYRQVSAVYRDDYDHLIASGLYGNLTNAGLLVPHCEVDITPPSPELAYKVIRPSLVPFVSYPYEWSFSQLKSAAIATLQIQKTCLEFGMSLKDCSAYNMQFVEGRPVLIDSLSFEKYREGCPWVAYRQFCQHFLAPLALMSYRDVRLSQLLRVHIDGVPLDLASSILPLRTRLNLSLLSHVHLHARSQKRYADRVPKRGGFKVSRLSLIGIVDSLESAVRKLTWRPRGTEWVDYYQDTNYSREAFQDKKRIVSAMLDRINPTRVWDLGANVGTFSRLASDRGAFTVSMDVDPASVEVNHLQCVREKEENILPLVIDLTNPSPEIGWDNEERMSLAQRGPADMAMALALIHHVAISNNVPLNRIALFLSRICKTLIIEFVPKSDSQVRRLLATREDVFADYTKAAFEHEFGAHFVIMDVAEIRDSERTMYLLKNRES